MRTVLGIDAAWTDREPSGVAVAAEEEGGWRLLAAEPSYQHFFARARGQKLYRDPVGSLTTARELVDTAKLILGSEPDLVAIDMPLSRFPITERRTSDQAISKAFGAAYCATHSPSKDRPGKISDHLRSQFSDIGYELCTRTIATPGLIEVYPHPALVKLSDEKKRLPYKLSKARRYWPDHNQRDRDLFLFGEWYSIACVLDGYLSGCREIPQVVGERRKDLKAIEDMLDAAACCVVAIRALDGAATAYGDNDSAIWVPEPDPVVMARTLLPSSPNSARTDMRTEVFGNSLEKGGSLESWFNGIMRRDAPGE